MLKLLNADDYVPRTIHDIVYHSDRSKEAIEEIVEGYVPFPTAGKNGIILWGVPAQCVSSSANLSLSACLRPATTANARFNSASESTFACAIARTPFLIQKCYFHAVGMGNRKDGARAYC